MILLAQRKNMKTVLILLPLLGFLISCVPSDGDIVKKPKQNKGVLYSTGPISGVSYYNQTSQTYGVTNSSGEFYCSSGEVVEFYIDDSSVNYDDIFIGATKCVSIVSPIELVTWGSKRYYHYGEDLGMSGISNDYDVALERLLAVLEVMDYDENPDNGIQMIQSHRNAFVSKFKNNPYAPEQFIGNLTASSITDDDEFMEQLETMEDLFDKRETIVPSNSHFRFKEYTQDCVMNNLCSNNPLF